MDGMAARASSSPAHSLPVGAPGGGVTEGQQAPPPASPPAVGPGGPCTERLCQEFSRLLEASGAGLQEVQRELAVSQRAEAAAGRIEAAAVQAALAGVEAAADAAEQSASRLPTAAARSGMQPAEDIPAVSAAGAATAGSRPSSAAAPATALDRGQPESSTLDAAGGAMVAVHAEDALPTSPCLGSPPVAAAALLSPPCAGDEAPPLTQPAQQTVEAPAAAFPASVLGTAAVSPPSGGSSAAEAAAAADPADGWPVQWQQPAALGIPLLPPPQQQWFLPAGGACVWPPPADLAPVPVQLPQPQLGAELCWGQPCAGGSPCPAERQHSLEWEPPFSVASDEELPGSPSSCSGGPALFSTAVEEESGSRQGAEQSGARPADGSGARPQQMLLERQGGEEERQQGEGEQQAQREQAMLDELAALSIRQYQQARQLVGAGRAAAVAAWAPAGMALQLIAIAHSLPSSLAACPPSRGAGLRATAGR